MGTNYYVRTPTCENACEHCSKSDLVHLGKSSAGWKFTFQADDDWDRDAALTKWIERAQSGQIEDEYGDTVNFLDLLSLILSKQDGRCHNVDHGPGISGPYWGESQKFYFHDRGFDFCDREFS